MCSADRFSAFTTCKATRATLYIVWRLGENVRHMIIVKFGVKSFVMTGCHVDIGCGAAILLFNINVYFPQISKIASNRVRRQRHRRRGTLNVVADFDIICNRSQTLSYSRGRNIVAQTYLITIALVLRNDFAHFAVKHSGST